MDHESFLEEGEIIVEKARKHWIVYVQDIFSHTFGGIIFILTAHFLSRYGGVFGSYGALIVGSIVLLFWVSFFYAWTMNYFDVWHITNQHIVAVNQKKILEREEAFMNLSRIQDVSFDKKGFFQTWLGYGKLHVQSAGTEQEFVLEDVHDVENMAHAILEQRDKANQTKVENL
jgi:hypothetical protein